MFGFGDSDKKKKEPAGGGGGGAGGGGGGNDPAAAGAGDGGGGDEPKVSTMPEGDYNIHIHLQKVQNVYLQGESEVDAYIQIDCLGQQEKSKVMDNITPSSIAKLDQHIFIELKKMDNEEMENGVIKFTILNKGFFKGDCIGEIELSIQKVYNKKNHTMMHQKVGVTDPNGEDFSKMTGLICMSININGPGDDAQELVMGTNKEIEKNKVIMPSAVIKVYKQLYLRIFKATHLPKMDWNLIGKGTIDAFIQVSYRGKKKKTKVITQDPKSDEVSWMEEFLIPVQVPTIDNKIILKLFDDDATGKELAATASLNVKFMLKSIYQVGHPNFQGKKCKWINLYGAPAGRSGDNSDKMKNDPTAASNWKGRILVEFWSEDIKYPVFKKRKLKPDFDRDGFDSHILDRKYMICGEFGQGLCLPGQERYRLRFRVGELEYTSSKPKNQSRDWCRWDERFGSEVIDFPYTDVKYFPTFFIYLVDDDNTEICFYKSSLYEKLEDGSQRFGDKNAPIQWVNFSADLAHGEVTDDKKAGYFSFRLYFHDVGKDGPFDPKKVPSWKADPPKRLTPYKARVAIYQCENLPPADESGSSDPYIQVYDPENEEGGPKTEICEDTNNPIFYEVKEFKFQAPSKRGKIDLAGAPPLIINIFDHDDGLFDSTDDLIGRSVIHLEGLQGGNGISFNDDISYPVWHAVKKNYDDDYDEDTSASILCSVQIKEWDEDYVISPPEAIILNAEPPSIGKNKILKMPSLNMSEFKCEIIVLGLRNLVSTGLMNINKAYCKFAVKSLLPVSMANAVDNVFTQPNSKGPNPIIRTSIQFQVMLPDDPTFLPKMTCEVFDQLFGGGFSQPLVGTFSLDFGHTVTTMREKIQNDINTTKQYCKTVEKVLKRIKDQPAETRERAAEICLQISLSQKGTSEMLTDEQKLGLAMLRKLEEHGLQIPTTNSMKRRGRKCCVKDKKKEKKKKDKTAIEEDHIEVKDAGDYKPDDFARMTPGQQKEAMSNAIGGNIRKKLQIAMEADIAIKKQAAEQERYKQQLEMATRPGAFGNKMDPTYQFDERLGVDVEVDIPKKDLFIPVGYNKKSSDGIKHYRRFYQDELENSKDKDGNPIVVKTFQHEKIFRSKPAKSGGLLGLFGDSGGDMVSVRVGDFKGVIRCYVPEERERKENELRGEMRKLMEHIIEIYELEQNEEAPIRPDLIERIPKMSPLDSEEALIEIRECIQAAGLEKLNLFNMIDDLSFQQSLLERLNKVQKCTVFLYMIEGFNFAQRDLFSASDPYLKVHCGNAKFNDRDNYQVDTSNPRFGKCYQFEAEFPGSPQLQIEAYDYDTLFGDDLIGKTKLDLDDRFYSQPWLALEDKPVEYRDLRDESSTMSQGVVKLWVEIYDADDPEASKKPKEIEAAPDIEFECRVVIWKTDDIEMMDVEGTSDAFVRCYFDNKEDQTTDTHWRCQNGTASFNYRLKYPLHASIPLQEESYDKYLLTVQAWDKDIIASNDLIGEFQLPIHNLVEDALLTDKPRYINYTYWNDYMKDQLEKAEWPLADKLEFESSTKSEDRFWLPVSRMVEDKEGNLTQKEAGKIMLSVCVLPKHHAEKNEQGKGRDEPNSDPHCPPPEGRIKLSLNPFTMFMQMVGPEVRRKIYCFLLCIACAFLCTMMAPMIFSNLVTKAMVG